MESLRKKFFVLQPETDLQWPRWKKVVFYLYRVALLLGASLCLGAALLTLAFGPYRWRVYLGYWRVRPIPALNLLPVVLLIFLCYGLTGRMRAAFWTGGGIALAFSLGNHYKLQFRDDPLYFEDLLVLREAGNMAGGSRYTLFLNNRILMCILALVIGGLLLRLLAPGHLRGWKPRTAAAAASVLAAAALLPIYLDEDLYDSIANFGALNQWSATQNYISRGFFYPFLHSITNFVDTPPEGYKKEEAAALLAAYEDADIPEDRQINLIAIMREAYTDFSQYGVEGLDGSAYDLYHQLEAESYTGNLVTNVFMGGTIDTERCFLTGNYQLRNFRGSANSYLWYLRDQGYTVEGSHPYYEWFYNRKNINAHLGFERYRFLEGDYDRWLTGLYPKDADVLPEIYADFAANKATGKPYCSFSVNVESHGPYETEKPGAQEYLTGDYSAACRNAVNNYLSILRSTDEALMELVERLRADPEPVVLVTFGDHLPWMGDGNAFYEEMGIDVDPGTEEGFYRHYTTRYLIWANGAARALLGKDLQGQGPDISPCYLMNLVFQQLGWEGPAFMQAMTGMMNMFPVVSSASGLTMVDGRLTADIPEDRRALFQEFLYLQQYWRNEFLYE